MSSPCFDIAVVGAGPAGSIAARVAAERGLTVALIDTSSPNQRLVGESLIGAARPLLRKLGLEELLNHPRHLPSFGNLAAWGSPELISMDFIRDPNGHGLHLDRRQFDSDLRDAAAASGVDVQKERLRNIQFDGSDCSLQLSRSKITSRFVIDASGRAAVVAKRCGSFRTADDDLRAIYRFAHTSPHDKESRTVIESTSYGWWYTARVADHCRIVAVHLNHAASVDLREDFRGFNELLARTQFVGRYFQDVEWLTQPNLRDASGARLNNFFGEQWIATGDAALSFDPLSSQGIFNALYTGMKAGEAVAEAFAGKALAISQYAERLESIRAHYLQHRAFAYSGELRWMDQPFWSTRSSLPRMDMPHQVRVSESSLAT